MALTRRTFLEQFGLAGGSTLVMTAMRSWELMAAQAGPRPVLPGRPAGTLAENWARELGRLGHTVRLISPNYVKAYVRRQKNDRADAGRPRERYQSSDRPCCGSIAARRLER